jgi:hypothetical protein
MNAPTMSTALAAAHQSDLHTQAERDRWARLARPDKPKHRRTWHRPSLKVRFPVRRIVSTG